MTRIPRIPRKSGTIGEEVVFPRYLPSVHEQMQVWRDSWGEARADVGSEAMWAPWRDHQRDSKHKGNARKYREVPGKMSSLRRLFGLSWEEYLESWSDSLGTTSILPTGTVCFFSNSASGGNTRLKT